LPLVSDGYDEATLRYLESPANIEEIEMLRLHRERAPMRLQDLPVPPGQVPGWVEYLEPSFPARSNERFVYIAPSPIFARLQRLDDRMGLGVGACCRAVLHR